jgi:hypothetical protein
MIRQTISSRRFRTVAASALALGLTFSAGTVFGARSADPLLQDATAKLWEARTYLEISSPGSTDARAQRTYDRYVGTAIKAIDNAIAAIEDAAVVASQP